MNRFFLIGSVVLIAIAAFVAVNALFIVHQTQQAIVLQFGAPRLKIKEPGLKFKTPFIQNVVYLEKRILDLDAPVEEVFTSDRKQLLVDAFARYRITEPLNYFTSFNSETLRLQENAEKQLANQLNSTLKNVIAAADFTAVISTDRSDLMRRIRDQLNSNSQRYGVEIVDVRIKRADLPEQNSQATYERMVTERRREAAEFRAQGEEAALRIRSSADREVTVLKAQAKRDSEIIRGEGDAERNRIFAEAFGKDPDFFAFYRSMLAYEAALRKGDTTMILSPDSEFFRYFGDLEGKGAR